jgi:hypothetical protein
MSDHDKQTETPPAQPIREEKHTPGAQERKMTEEESLDDAVDDTFPASDPVQPSRIDGPNN